MLVAELLFVFHRECEDEPGKESLVDLFLLSVLPYEGVPLLLRWFLVGLLDGIER